MYRSEGEHFDSAGSALDGYIQEWERDHGRIQTPTYSVRDNQGIKRAVLTIWSSLWVNEKGSEYLFGVNESK